MGPGGAYCHTQDLAGLVVYKKCKLVKTIFCPVEGIAQECLGMVGW